MTAIRKTYVSKFFNRLQTKVIVKGKAVLVDFKGASNQNTKGIFSTNNPDLIDALEKDVAFNTDYVLQKQTEELSGEVDSLEIRSMEVNPPEEIQEEIAVPLPGNDFVGKLDEKEVQEQEQPEKIEASPLDIVGADRVTNVQEAKEYLKNKFEDLTARQISNKALILEVAKEKGIVFEALN